MTQQEIIKYIKDEIENETDTYHWFDDTPKNKTRLQIEESINAHQGLLDLYINEKSLNDELQIRYKIENDKYKIEKQKNQKQDTEINKLNNVIDRMVKHIVEQTYKDLEECEFEDKYNINCNSSKRTCEDCIKEYFMK